VKWPDVQEHLEAPCPLLVKQLFLLLNPILLPIVVILLVIEPEVKEVKPPRLFGVFVQLTPLPLEYPGGCSYEPLVRVSAAAA
jgi:hypothetical protein